MMGEASGIAGSGIVGRAIAADRATSRARVVTRFEREARSPGHPDEMMTSLRDGDIVASSAVRVGPTACR
jgi:hypothetical protein